MGIGLGGLVAKTHEQRPARQTKTRATSSTSDVCHLKREVPLCLCGATSSCVRGSKQKNVIGIHRLAQITRGAWSCTVWMPRLGVVKGVGMAFRTKTNLSDQVEAIKRDVRELAADIAVTVFDLTSRCDLLDDAGADHLEALRSALSMDRDMPASERTRLARVLDDTESDLLSLKRSMLAMTHGDSLGVGRDDEFVSVRGRPKFHRPDCEWLLNTPSHRLQRWANHDAAVDAGKKPCATCRA